MEEELITFIPGSQMPYRDGSYRVKLSDGSLDKLWWIARKQVWVTMDGQYAVSGVQGFAPQLMDKPQYT